MSHDEHLLYQICVIVVVTIYIVMGLVFVRDDKKLTRQLQRSQLYTPIFGYVMIFVIIAYWPLKSVLGALVWTVNEYQESK